MFGTQTSKVWSLEGNSLDEDSRVIQRKTEREEFKIILKFRKEDENVQSSPIAFNRELKKKFGEVQLAKILRDGNLLIVVTTEVWKNKVLNDESICKKTVGDKRILGENKVTWLQVFL